MAIDLPRMLLLLREMLAYGDPAWGVAPAGRLEAGAYRLWSRLIRNRRLYEAALKLGVLGQQLLPRSNGMVRRLPPPFDGWSRNRDLHPLARRTFTERWRNTRTR